MWIRGIRGDFSPNKIHFGFVVPKCVSCHVGSVIFTTNITFISSRETKMKISAKFDL